MVRRIYIVLPIDLERFYLRILLNHVRGPTSFDNLLTCQGIRHNMSQKATQSMGLIKNDQSIFYCLVEAMSFQVPSALQRLFVTIMVYYLAANIRLLWDKFRVSMMQDYCSTSTCSESF